MNARGQYGNLAPRALICGYALMDARPPGEAADVRKEDRMIEVSKAQALFKAIRGCESEMAAGIAQTVAVSRILEERDEYRDAALRAECRRRDMECGCGEGCPAAARYCAAVVEEVESGIGQSAAEELEDMLEELGGWPPKRKRPSGKSSDR